MTPPWPGIKVPASFEQIARLGDQGQKTTDAGEAEGGGVGDKEVEQGAEARAGDERSDEARPRLVG